MNRKNIFKTLAAAMLMPAMLLTTSCSSEDDLLNTENTAKKGYTIPVTINVSRQGDDATTRATYTDNGNKTGKLDFSAGDKLFVSGSQATAGDFAGTLDYKSDGTFSGTISTGNEYSGTIDDLLASAYAYLLPDGYENYGYLSVSGSGYGASYDYDMTKAFALTKAAAVEQFSREWAYGYSSGFDLEPNNAILNFTVNGLADNTKVAVAFTIYNYGEIYATITGNVTTDASGTATFAIGVEGGIDLNECTLTVGGNDITLVSSSKTLVAGKIYNITRSAASAAAEGHALSASSLGEIVGSDGKAYAVADKDNLPTGVTAVAMIAYVGSATDHATYKNGLAIALSDEGSMEWSTAKSTCEGKNTSAAVANAVWLLPSQNQWKAMFNANGGSEESSTGLNNALATAGGNSSKFQEYGRYWSSTELDAGFYGTKPFYVYVGWGYAIWDHDTDDIDAPLARACLAF